MRWYNEHHRDLPWRKTSDPYKIWISEIMLQQTTVNAVIPYYERWIKEFPTVHRTAKAPLEKILKLWQGLGYYSRARNIHKSAQVICAEHQGKIPGTKEHLKKLPGFGPYTVGAVLSIAFDQREPIIDANVRRVVMRQLAIQGAADRSHDVKIFKFLDDVMPTCGNNIFNQALMELGALVCRNREPICTICPVRKNCLAYKKNIQEIIPTPKKKIIKKLDVSIGVLRKNNKFYIQKRSSKGLLADLWEFPGGKIEKGETPEDAVHREIMEEVGIKIKSVKPFMNLVHFYTDFKIYLNVFWAEPKDEILLNKERKWVNLKSLLKYPMPSGSAKIVEVLLKL